MEDHVPRQSQRSQLILDNEELDRLTRISQSLTAPIRAVQRAKAILLYARGTSITQVQKEVGISRPTIYKCIDKALAAGAEHGLKDKYHRAHAPVITKEAKEWVLNVACTKPKDHGYAAELWTLSLLAKHARCHAPSAGHDCLNRAAKATIQRILKEHPLQPHKVRYYLERRDPEFDAKMRDVQIIYKEINDLLDHPQKRQNNKVITLSVDEKPGVQAIKNTAPDLAPKPGQYATVSRDYEYKRLGTLSILAALDLLTGHVIAQVHNRHRSREFISLLKEIDAYYPSDYKIRIILDNHSAHISKETMAYLATRPNRFVYVHTPKHGSWLNLVETLFSKMARTFLRHIRVDTKDELRSRILKGVDEINNEPVIHRWRKFAFA